MRVRALAVLVLVGATAAGCGGGTKSNGEASKPAQQILADAKQAATSATAVHYHGSIVNNGSHVTIDLTVDSTRGGTGTMSMQNLSFDLVRIGDKAYIRGSDAFYAKFAGAAAAQLLHGRWLEFPADNGQLAVLTELTDIGKFFALFKGKSGVVKGAETTVDGQKAIAIRSNKTGGTMYVATTGKPYPIEVVGGRSSPGTITFDGWGKTVALTAPKGAIDISKLGG